MGMIIVIQKFTANRHFCCKTTITGVKLQTVAIVLHKDEENVKILSSKIGLKESPDMSIHCLICLFSPVPNIYIFSRLCKQSRPRSGRSCLIRVISVCFKECCRAEFSLQVTSLKSLFLTNINQYLFIYA